jgi:ribonuclease Z
LCQCRRNSFEFLILNFEFACFIQNLKFKIMHSILRGHSKALYSTWIFYRPDRLLLDCGEGAATQLGNESYAIERILLTHGHIDHISGLPSLLWARASGMGDKQKPVEIFYPQGDAFVADMRAYLEKTATRLPFQVTWRPTEANADLPLPGGKRRLQTFATKHIPNRLTLGYKIVEPRRRLKAEFAALSQEEIRQMATAQPKGSAALSEAYEAILIAFGGDGLALNPDDVRGAELLFHEATLLYGAERKSQWHATLDEAVQSALAAQVKTLVLYHLSGRYSKNEIITAAEESLKRHSADFPLWILRRDQLLPVQRIA